MKASEMALQAAQVMSERGHCKGKLEDDDGRVCFSGALCVAAYGDARYWLKQAYAEYASYQASENYANWGVVDDCAAVILRERGIASYPVEYNNDESVTGEDVILLLKETAARLEEAGK